MSEEYKKKIYYLSLLDVITQMHPPYIFSILHREIHIFNQLVNQDVRQDFALISPCHSLPRKILLFLYGLQDFASYSCIYASVELAAERYCAYSDEQQKLELQYPDSAFELKIVSDLLFLTASWLPFILKCILLF